MSEASNVIITNPTVYNGIAIRIPEKKARYRANCHKDWGRYVSNNIPKGMSILDASKGKFVFGEVVELAMCSINKRILTFSPHFTNEWFTEIWGIPVSGEIKDQFPAQASELITFLIHRQSQDKLQGMVDEFSRDAFSQWVEGGMQGDPGDFAVNKASEVFGSKIFSFSFVKRDGKNGPYHAIACTTRDAVSDFEKAALDVARAIHAQSHIHCIDPQIVQNEIASMNSMPALPESDAPAIEASPLSSAQPAKSLKGSK